MSKAKSVFVITWILVLVLAIAFPFGLVSHAYASQWFVSATYNLCYMTPDLLVADLGSGRFYMTDIYVTSYSGTYGPTKFKLKGSHYGEFVVNTVATFSQSFRNGIQFLGVMHLVDNNNSCQEPDTDRSLTISGYIE